MTLGLRIQTLRTQLKMTQSELAKDLCSPSFISQIEADKAIPSQPLLEELAARLKVQMETLTQGLSQRHSLKALVKSVDRSIRKGNDLQALHLLKQTVPDSQEELIQWLILIGDFSIRLGLAHQAFEAFRMVELILPAESNNRNHLYRRLLPRLAIASLILQRYELGKMWLDKLLRLHEVQAGEIAFALAGKAALAYVRQDYEACAAYLQEALEYLPKGTAHSDRAAGYTMLSILDQKRGNLEDALQAAEIAVTLWKTEKRWHEELQARTLLSSILLEKGAASEAAAWLTALAKELASISDPEDPRLQLLDIEVRLHLAGALYAEDPQAAFEHLQEAGRRFKLERTDWHPSDPAVRSVAQERFLFGLKEDGQAQVDRLSVRSNASFGTDVLLPLYLKEEQDLMDLWNQKIQQFPAFERTAGNA